MVNRVYLNVIVVPQVLLDKPHWRRRHVEDAECIDSGTLHNKLINHSILLLGDPIKLSRRTDWIASMDEEDDARPVHLEEQVKSS